MRGDEDKQGPCGGRLPDGVSPGELIRMAADGELTDEQVAAFEKLCAERDCTRDRVLFEQTLRECCGRVMRDKPCCPEALRTRIRAMAASQSASHAADHGQTDSFSVVEAMAPRTRSVAFWRRSPGLAAAAVVLLSLAGVLIYQGARVPTGQTPGSPGWSGQTVAYQEQVARFVAAEHVRCCQDEAAESKMIVRDLGQARDRFARSLGVASLDLSADLPSGVDIGSVTFYGAGDCHVPGSSRSVHARYDATSPDGTPVHLSLFVMPDEGQLALADGKTYVVTSSSCEEKGVNLFAWREGGVIYLLVSEAQGNFCKAVRKAFHAPDAVGTL
ncbi:MAG: hypothetical protein D6692_06955 [Planctomycetota bacterium]|nr:MAG: hypothetical protein D6692_06955 [Planctomycetota bacterium]